MTTENKTRNAYLPMNLLNDGDLDIINNSNLTGGDRDIAVFYFIASRMLDMTQITIDIFKNIDDDALHTKTDLANFLVKNGKSNVSQNLLENFEEDKIKDVFTKELPNLKLINRRKK